MFVFLLCKLFAQISPRRSREVTLCSFLKYVNEQHLVCAFMPLFVVCFFAVVEMEQLCFSV